MPSLSVFDMLAMHSFVADLPATWLQRLAMAGRPVFFGVGHAAQLKGSQKTADIGGLVASRPGLRDRDQADGRRDRREPRQRHDHRNE